RLLGDELSQDGGRVEERVVIELLDQPDARRQPLFLLDRAELALHVDRDLDAILVRLAKTIDVAAAGDFEAELRTARRRGPLLADLQFAGQVEPLAFFLFPFENLENALRGGTTVG